MQLKEALYDWNGWNTTLFYAVNRHGHSLDSMMLLGSALGKYTLFPVYLALFAACMLARLRQVKAHSPERCAAARAAWFETLLVLCLAYAFSLAWIPLLKHGFHFTRPYALLPPGSVTILDSVIKSENPYVSFPSGHSEFAMLMVAGLWPMLKGAGKIPAVAFFLWVALSRLYLGVHFPADVFYSALLSLCAVLAVRYAVRRMLAKRLAVKT